MMVIENKFELGQLVFIKTDTDQYPRMVISISVRQGGLLYELNFAQSSSWHYEIEISDEKDVLNSILN